jgi:hypothetical protein
MGNKLAGIIFRFSLIIFLMCLIMAFIVDFGTPEFIITIVSIMINLIIICICLIKIRKG